jgi:hypothetical protein
MYELIFLAMIVFSILYAFGNYFPIFDFVYYLPFFDMLRKPSIILFLSAFSISMLSGLGLDSLLKKPQKQKVRILIGLLFVGIVLSTIALVAIHLQKDRVLSIADKMLINRYESFTRDEHQLKYGIEYYRQRIPGAYNHIIKSLVIFDILLLSSILLLYVRMENIISLKRFKVFVLLVIIFDLWIFGMKYIQVEDPNKMLPPEVDRCQYETWRTDGDEIGMYRIFDTLDLNSLAGTSDCFSQYLSMRYGAETIWGDDSTVLESYKKFTDSALSLFEESASSDIKLNPKILGMLNVKYVVTMEEIDESGLILDHIQPTHEYVGYMKTQRTKDVYVYENTQFLPRAFVVHDAKIMEDVTTTMADILSDEFNPKEYVILHEDIDVELENAGDFESADVTYVSSHEFRVQIQTTNPGFLVISQNWYPGWIAYDNGEMKQIQRANYAFSAVHIDAGAHDIRFVYNPVSFNIGKYITLWTSVILLVSIGYGLYIRRLSGDKHQ